MRLRPASSLAAALLLAAAPGAALAQGTAAKAPALTKAQIEDIAFRLRVMVSALQSDKVDAQAKEALSQCIYNNSFAKINETMGKVIAENTGKVDKRNADQTLFIMVRVCGYDPAKTAAAKPGATPAKPATPAARPATKPAPNAPQGR